MIGRVVLQGAVGATVRVEGRDYLLFGATDYLGMSSRPELAESLAETASRCGISPASSRISLGTNEVHLELEREIASFFSAADAVVASTGFMAMTTLLDGVHNPGDIVMLQQDAHPSIRMAVSSKDNGPRTFSLEDLGSLADAVEKAPGRRVLVVGEGVSPLFGTVFPLPGVLEILGDRDALVLLDDAHSCGVLGRRGRGTADHYQCEDERVLSCGTLSKAFGAFGGFVPGSRELAARIRSCSLAYQSSTPPPAALAASALASLRYVGSHRELFGQLRDNSRRLKEGLASLGIRAENPDVPIAPVCEIDGLDLEALSGRLMEEGIIAPYSRYPGSPSGGMIRLAVTAGHTGQQIGRLMDSLDRHI